ncbi:MAG: hypothetical protein R2688_01310 [Fimbriimonadaceae bacterium]
MASGKPIVYTSADSVFRRRHREDVIPIEELYRSVRIARRLCVAPHNVQRVIAAHSSVNQAISPEPTT